MYLGPFARKFQAADVWVAPNLWSYPVNIPLGWLGLFPRKANIIPEDDTEVPWRADFQHAILGPISIGLGTSNPFNCISLFYRPLYPALLMYDFATLQADECTLIGA